MPADLPSLARALAAAGKSFYERGWVLGTGGNFSAVLSREPFELAITATGLHKGELAAHDFLVVDASATVLSGTGKPSAETSIHIAIAQATGAGAVLHTHSVWATILSEKFATAEGFEIEGYEMLKGLAGITTHLHREWIPILDNTQDYPPLVREILNLIDVRPEIHGFLLQRHGLYTWGRDVSEAKRHVEILEFLFEVIGRK